MTSKRKFFVLTFCLLLPICANGMDWIEEHLISATVTGIGIAAFGLLGYAVYPYYQDIINRAFLNAIKQNNLQRVQLLVKFTPDINKKDINGREPIHVAAFCGREENVEFLLRAGADVNAKDNYGTTSLHVAAWNDSKEVLELLLRAGADKDAQNNDGEMPLHKAVRWGCKENIELLLRAGAAGADKNAQDKDGMTSFHMAAWYNNKEVITLFLLFFSKKILEQKTKNGRTVLDLAHLLAYQTGDNAMVVFLSDKNKQAAAIEEARKSLIGNTFSANVHTVMRNREIGGQSSIKYRLQKHIAHS